MIVEFAGLPGSGKTSITRELREADARIDRKVMSSDVAAALGNPVALVATFARTGIWRGSLTRVWLKLVMRHHHQRRMTSDAAGMLILEEGVTHHLWRALFLHDALDRAPWQKLVDVPQLLIVLEAAPEIRRERIKAKTVASGEINRALAATDPSGEPWRRGEEILERMMKSASQTRQVIRIPTDGDLRQAVARVRASIT